MTANLGSLVVDLALESAQFIAGMRNAQAQANTSSKAISAAMAVGKTALGGLAGVLSVNFLADQVQSAFDFGDAIVDLSDRTGASTRFLQEFRYAAQMSGSSVESADAAVEKFSKNLGSALNGNKAMAKTLSDLGVKSNETDVAFRQFSDGVAKLPTLAQRNAAATSVLGKSAGDLTSLLGQGSRGFDELAQAAESYGVVLDDQVLRNGGKVNDQLDTMKMILNAQMAGAILQNADALFSLAQGFITAASAASQFFQAMDVARSMSVINSDGSFGSAMQVDIPKMISGLVRGKSAQEMKSEEAQHLLTFKAGRNALYDAYKSRYNQNNAKGMGKDSQEQKDLRDSMTTIVRAEVAARQSLRPPTAPVIHLPTGGTKPKPKHEPKGPTLKTDEELAYQWNREMQSATLDQYRENLNLSIEPDTKAGLQRSISGIEHDGRLRDIDADTGTDQEVREGKKRLTAAQAEELKQVEDATEYLRLQNIDTQESEAIAQERLQVATAGLENQKDDLVSQEALARSTRQRRDLALKIVANEFEQQRLQQEAIVASTQSTKAEKEIAKAKLAMLPYLKKQAEEAAKKQNQSPMEAYLDKIPKTAGEINDQLETVETEGLDALQDGLLAVIHGTESVGEAFHNMVNGILDGLLKIALQQAIIKPLGEALFGGGDGGGLGGIFGSIFKSIGGAALGGGGSWYAGPGARANGGYTGKGDYLVGERGPEWVSIGAEAALDPQGTLRAADQRSGQKRFRSEGTYLVGDRGPETITLDANAMVTTNSEVQDANPLRLDGARANGGLTKEGNYLVGERGPELVSIGANANVTTTADLQGIRRGGDGGVTIKIDSIVSNDPVAVRRMVAEGVMAAIPAITQQATDKTMAKLRRPTL